MYLPFLFHVSFHIFIIQIILTYQNSSFCVNQHSRNSYAHLSENAILRHKGRINICWQTCNNNGLRISAQWQPMYAATPTMLVKNDSRKCRSCLSFKKVIMCDSSTSFAEINKQCKLNYNHNKRLIHDVYICDSKGKSINIYQLLKEN